MFNRRSASVLAAAAITTALGLVPVGTAQAATQAACVWQKTAWELPTGTNDGILYGSDGSRYGVGLTGTMSTTFPYGIKNGLATLWDNGKVVLRLPSGTNASDVNSSGLMAGSSIVNNKFTAVKVSPTGTKTALPSNPTWSGAEAKVINNAGDIAGVASIGTKSFVVVWPASAPGTYRELPTPSTSTLILTDIDEQGRTVGYTDAGGFVTDLNGQWHTLAAKGTNATGEPTAIRDGRIVGSINSDTSYSEAEWDAQGTLVRTITNGAIEARAIGGNGTVGGLAFVNSVSRSVLWSNGVVSDSLSSVSQNFQIAAISTDEKKLIGNDAGYPSSYTCS
ncbi:hypothetical protein [Streptomyces sp. 1331.2]|uniref:hypothetical protein n=1 Tax=Streptomyces sp. 1331.2 TaxID=1938835 RepID=UPI000BCD7659|nr:hypothetical protein [Streptomyces sp. 1331.2]SOB82460.1 hypothetical protein SAMN06272789_2626 [Streptomyces sp. 1331.2]